jgi:hypothetical protein
MERRYHRAPRSRTIVVARGPSSPGAARSARRSVVASRSPPARLPLSPALLPICARTSALFAPARLLAPRRTLAFAGTARSRASDPVVGVRGLLGAIALRERAPREQLEQVPLCGPDLTRRNGHRRHPGQRSRPRPQVLIGSRRNWRRLNLHERGLFTDGANHRRGAVDRESSNPGQLTRWRFERERTPTKRAHLPCSRQTPACASSKAARVISAVPLPARRLPVTTRFAARLPRVCRGVAGVSALNARSPR